MGSKYGVFFSYTHFKDLQRKAGEMGYFGKYRFSKAGWEQETRPAVMDVNAKKELFSSAYLHAITSVAGFAYDSPRPDNQSVDWTLYARAEDGFPRSPRLDIQLKCTGSPDIRGDVIKYALPCKNYDDLRRDSYVPIILVTVVVPRDVSDWLDQSPERLVLRNCAYWVSLRGTPEVDNDHTVTVDVPLAQVFSVEALCDIMRRIGEGREV